jgi:hypothetical protein
MQIFFRKICNFMYFFQIFLKYTIKNMEIFKMKNFLILNFLTNFVL